MAEHTPGPWRIGESWMYRNQEFPYYSILHGDPPQALTDGVLGSPEERRPNARLIAAAPELLAALEGLVRTCEADGVIYRWPDLGVDLKEARAAIAKAKEGV